MHATTEVGAVTSLAFLAACASRAPTPPAPDPDPRPNVILIMTDDQGYGDFGFHGNPVLRTPNLDAMAERSARLQTFYVNPVCTPTRAALMTGRYPQRTRAIDTYIGRAMMDPAEVTVAEALRGEGYATGIFGKWHLGDCYPMRASDQGFDESLVHRGGGIGQSSDPEGGERRYTDAWLFHNDQLERTRGYCTDVYFDAAIDWLGKTRATGKPFFAYIATNAPHGPFHDVPPELFDDYRNRDLSPDRFPETNGHSLPAEHDAERLARIFAMIENVDHNVGKLFEALDDRGLTDNTLVLFLVDNGPNSRRYVRGMRGMKTTVYEGGVRSPLWAHWPARLAPNATSDRVAAHIDVTPTILDACGAPLPPGVKLDGRSVLPLLAGNDATWPNRSIVAQSHRGDEAVRYHNFMLRTQDWKLLNASGFGKELTDVEPSFELYDMRTDPLELHDVAAENPEVVARLRASYDAWFDDVSSTRPDNYAPPRIHIGGAAPKRVTLTRQDWRRLDGDEGPRKHSRGHWELRVNEPGPYRVRVRFPKNARVARAVLHVGHVETGADVAGTSRGHTFASVAFPPGDTRLRVSLTTDDKPQDAYQVHVERL